MTRSLLLLALAGTLLATTAAAQSLPPPPSMNDPAPEAKPARKPAPKPRAKPAEAAGEAAKPAARRAPAAKAQGYTEGPSAPRKIDPRDIDDPYGGVGPRERTAPAFTPSGKIGVGGRF